MQWLPAKLIERRGKKYAVLRVEDGEDPITAEGMFLVQVRYPRNPKFHRLYWAALQSVVESTGAWLTKEQLHNWVKVELGFYETAEIAPGVVVTEWLSTNFWSMGERQFRNFFEHAMVAISLKTGIDPLEFTEGAFD